MAKAVLIFPAGMPRSLEFLGDCLREGRKVIGASSRAYDPSREHYPVWLTLPYVTNPTFDTALAQALREHDIGGIYTPHLVVWNYLNRSLGRIAPGVPLLNASPMDADLHGYRAARDKARGVLNEALPIAVDQQAKPNLSELEIASLYRHADGVPGQCDPDKMRGLYEVARYCPAGDVVEIGSLWGKSALVLLRLSQCFGIGNVLCVDPWSDRHLIQNDESGLVDITSAYLGAEEAFAVFRMNLLPYSRGDINYLRLPSTDAAAHYRQQAEATSPAFGRTTYSGRIALLHIDGNHNYDNVKADIAAWSALMTGGGWIVLDDYTWPFGSGPKQAADEFLAAQRERITAAFVMGGALFMRLA